MTPAEAEAHANRETYLLRWERMKQIRATWEPAWRYVRDFVLPRLTIDPVEVPGALLNYQITDNTAQVANDRLAQTLHGHLLSPYTPFLFADVEEEDATKEEKLWFDQVTRIMFRMFTGAKTLFKTSIAEVLPSDTALGTSIIYIGSELGALPIYQSVPVTKAWIDENEYGLVDTVYRDVEMPRWRVFEKYPGKIPELEEKRGRADELNAGEAFVHIVEPRRRADAGATDFIDAMMHVGTKRIVRAGIYRSFPYAVSRFMKIAGSVYGYSPGIKSLPLVFGINRLEQMRRLRAEYDALPPLIDFTGGEAFGQLDLRAGARNTIDPELYRAWHTDPVKAIPLPGNGISIDQAIDRLERKIQYTFYVDWMSPGEGPEQTATEVLDRREIRFKGMSSITSRKEVEQMSPLGERSFEILDRGRFLPPAPESLRGRDIKFEYRSPISLAQRQTDIEALSRALDFTTAVAQIRPDVVANIDWDAAVRHAAKGYGVPLNLIVDPEKVAGDQEAARDAAALSSNLEAAGLAADAYKKAGEGEAAMTKAAA